MLCLEICLDLQLIFATETELMQTWSKDNRIACHGISTCEVWIQSNPVSLSTTMFRDTWDTCCVTEELVLFFEQKIPLVSWKLTSAPVTFTGEWVSINRWVHWDSFPLNSCFSKVAVFSCTFLGSSFLPFGKKTPSLKANRFWPNNWISNHFFCFWFWRTTWLEFGFLANEAQRTNERQTLAGMTTKREGKTFLESMPIR